MDQSCYIIDETVGAVHTGCRDFSALWEVITQMLDTGPYSLQHLLWV